MSSKKVEIEDIKIEEKNNVEKIEIDEILSDGESVEGRKNCNDKIEIDLQLKESGGRQESVDCEVRENYGSENAEKTKVVKRVKVREQKSFFKEYLRWPLIVLFTAMIISLSFSVLSEIALDGSTLAVAIAVIVVFMVISVLTDIIGVAITAVDITPFRSMSAKKVSGAKEAIVLIKNADKVASVVADILGDICGILSGAAGAVVTNLFLEEVTGDLEQIFIASVVSAVIASVIIFGKALGKKFSLNHCDSIVLLLGKFVKVVTFNKIGNKKSKNK